MPEASGQAQAPDPVEMIQAQLNLEQEDKTAVMEAARTIRKQAKETKETPKEISKEAEKETKPEVKEETKEEEQKEPETNKQVEGDDIEIPLDRLEAIQLEVTVKGDDGKDVAEKPTIKELREGYMRQKDYSRKTAELARQREEVAEKTRQGIETERSQYLKDLQTLQQTFIETTAPELKDVNWNHLAANDPAEYVRLRNRADQISQVLQGLRVKQQAIETKTKADQSQILKKIAQEAIKVLESDIPGWNDTLYQTLMKSGEAVGYKTDEVAQWVDPRAIKLLHKAYLYDQLKAEKPPEKKTAVAPKVIKAGVAQDTSKAQQREVEAFKKLQSSGSISDAADVIRHRLGM